MPFSFCFGQQNNTTNTDISNQSCDNHAAPKSNTLFAPCIKSNDVPTVELPPESEWTVYGPLQKKTATGKWETRLCVLHNDRLLVKRSNVNQLCARAYDLISAATLQMSCVRQRHDDLTVMHIYIKSLGNKRVLMRAIGSGTVSMWAQQLAHYTFGKNLCDWTGNEAETKNLTNNNNNKRSKQHNNKDKVQLHKPNRHRHNKHKTNTNKKKEQSTTKCDDENNDDVNESNTTVAVVSMSTDISKPCESTDEVNSNETFETTAELKDRPKSKSLMWGSRGLTFPRPKPPTRQRAETTRTRSMGGLSDLGEFQAWFTPMSSTSVLFHDCPPATESKPSFASVSSKPLRVVQSKSCESLPRERVITTKRSQSFWL